jgi:cell division protein FtsW
MPYQMNKGQLLLIGISVLTVCGLLMVYSASMAAVTHDGDPLRFLVRQSIAALIGYALMILLMFVDYRRWFRRRTIFFLIAISILALVLVYTQAPVKGAHRAVPMGPIGSFQPSELAKLVLFFYLASFLEEHHAVIRNSIRPLLPTLGTIGAVSGLICIEPDLGQAICILAITMTLLFLAGLAWKYLGGAALLSLPALYFLVWEVGFRRRRLLDWLAALVNPLNAGYHIKQAIIGIGHGGLLGLGFGDGQQKLSYLPEAPTDFVYAVIGEEFGLVGSLVILAVFLGYLYLGLKISVRAPDSGGFFLGIALTLMVVLPAFINMSTALALVPTKGLTLPFISRGGSSLIVCLMATGILINISSQQKTE